MSKEVGRLNSYNLISQSIKPEMSDAITTPKVEFTYREPSKPVSTKTSIIGPAIRLIGTFLTLGLSEDVHRSFKKILVAGLNKTLATTNLSNEERAVRMEKFKKDPAYKNSTQLFVEIDKQAKLEGMLVAPSIQSEKYIIWLNGLGGCYESQLERLGEYADTLEANVLVFNYRGVGDSTSNRPVRPKDLVTDTKAMIAFLTEKGVAPEDIVIHGFSLGGGVGAQAALQAPGVKQINDRSFKSFSKAVKELVTLNLQKKIGKTAANVIGNLTAALIKGYNLDLDTSKTYQVEKMDTLILHHPKDEVIQKSSMKNFLDKHSLSTENPKPHKFVDLSSVKSDLSVHNTFFLNNEVADHVYSFVHGKSMFDLENFKVKSISDITNSEGISGSYTSQT